MSTYQATVERDGRFWLIRVADVGATQARHLREVEEMARDLIVNINDVQPEQVEVSWRVVLPRPVRRHLDEAARLRQEAAVTLSDAAAELRLAARELKAAGLPLRDIGLALGVSHQRAHQLVSSGRRRAAEPRE